MMTREQTVSRGSLARLVLAALTLGSVAACTSTQQVTQTQHACPAGQVPRIVDLKQGAKGIPTDAINDLCPKWIRQGDMGLIENFEDDDSQVAKLDGRGGYWWFNTDPQGSTIEPGSFLPEKGGASGKGHSMHVWGETSTAQGAYGSQLGADLKREGRYDASAFIGVRFKAKAKEGSSRGIRFKMADVNTHPSGEKCTDCWNHFGQDITLTYDWEDYVVLFEEMHQEPYWGDPRPSEIAKDQLINIDFTIKPGRKFDFWIDDLEFIQCQ